MSCASDSEAEDDERCDPLFFELLEELDRAGDTMETQRIATDLFCLSFDIGDVHDGAGERAQFAWALLELLPRFPELVLQSLALVPTIVTWRVLNVVAEEAKKRETDASASMLVHLHALRARIVQLFVNQLRADDARLDGLDACAAAVDADAGSSLRPVFDISLAAKWAPGMHSRYQRSSELGSAIRDALFGAGSGANDRRHRNYASMRYRQLLSRLRRHIGGVEQLMSAGKWADIDPARVSATAQRKYRRALLHINSSDEGRRQSARRMTKYRHAKSHHHDARIRRLNERLDAPSREIFKKVALQLFWNWDQLTPAETAAREAAWTRAVDWVRAQGTRKSTLVMVVDVGALNRYQFRDDPTFFAALALLLSQAHGRRLLGVQGNVPLWLELDHSKALRDRLGTIFRHIEDVKVNLATVLEMVLSEAIETSSEMPETLVVLSSTSFQKAAEPVTDPAAWIAAQGRFAEHGFTAPLVVFWNISADTFGWDDPCEETQPETVPWPPGFPGLFVVPCGTSVVPFFETGVVPLDLEPRKVPRRRDVRMKRTERAALQPLRDMCAAHFGTTSA